MTDRNIDAEFDDADDVDETFDPYDVEPQGRVSQGLVLAGAGLLTLVGFAAVVWAAYGQGVRDGMKRGPAVVAAPAETYRSRPEDPGGLTVPGQDSEVLAQAAGEGADGPSRGYDRDQTRGLDDLIKSEADEDDVSEPEDVIVDTPPADVAEEAETTVGRSDGAAAPAVTSAVDDREPASATSERAAPDTAPQTEAPPDPDANRTDEAPTSPAPASGDAVTDDRPSAPADPFFVQIASYRSAGDADVGWSRFAERNAALLTAGLGPDVEAADLGDRGVYHRLRVGPFDGRARADAFCDALRAADQTCLVLAG